MGHRFRDKECDTINIDKIQTDILSFYNYNNKVTRPHGKNLSLQKNLIMGEYSFDF